MVNMIQGILGLNVGSTLPRKAAQAIDSRHDARSRRTNLPVNTVTSMGYKKIRAEWVRVNAGFAQKIAATRSLQKRCRDSVHEPSLTNAKSIGCMRLRGCLRSLASRMIYGQCIGLRSPGGGANDRVRSFCGAASRLSLNEWGTGAVSPLKKRRTRPRQSGSCGLALSLDRLRALKGAGGYVRMPVRLTAAGVDSKRAERATGGS